MDNRRSGRQVPNASHAVSANGTAGKGESVCADVAIDRGQAAQKRGHDQSFVLLGRHSWKTPHASSRGAGAAPSRSRKPAGGAERLTCRPEALPCMPSKAPSAKAWHRAARLALHECGRSPPNGPPSGARNWDIVLILRPARSPKSGRLPARPGTRLLRHRPWPADLFTCAHACYAHAITARQTAGSQPSAGARRVFTVKRDSPGRGLMTLRIPRPSCRLNTQG